MEGNVPCKEINCCQPEGSRKKGRPRLSWVDSVLKDLKILEVKSSWRQRHTMGCSAKLEERKEEEKEKEEEEKEEEKKKRKEDEEKDKKKKKKKSHLRLRLWSFHVSRETQFCIYVPTNYESLITATLRHTDERQPTALS
jgi:superfamily II DNA helicase RecQ